MSITTISAKDRVSRLYSFLFLRGNSRTSNRPAIPENVQASRGYADLSVTVSWAPTAGAEVYLVFRSRDYNGPFSLIGKTISETRYVDQNVRAGIYYWYRVSSTAGFRVSEPGARVQGWINPFMPGGSETPKDLIKRLLLSLPHFFRVRREAVKRQPRLPEPRDITDLLPTDSEMFACVKTICAAPHRRIGSPEGLAAEDYLAAELRKILGDDAVEKEPVPCDVYNATEWKLEIEDNSGTREIDAFYTLNTGMTYEKNPRGSSVSGNMIWAGQGRPEDFSAIEEDLTGKIVVAQCPFPDFPLGILMKVFNNFYYTSDPSRSLNIRTKRNFTFARQNLPAEYSTEQSPHSVYWNAYDRGAAGLVLILHNHQGRVNTHWGPYDGKMRPIPCMYVDGYMNDEIRAFAEKGTRASITIQGSLHPGAGHNIFGILPGRSPETILVSSHHDAPFQGATEDATGVTAVLSLAKAWAQVPLEEREKNIVFAITTGHFYGGKGAREFAIKHRDGMLKNMVICINIEHIAAKDYVDDGTGNMVDHGEPALNFVFVNEDFTAISAARRMLQRHRPGKTVLLQSNLLGPVPPGEAGHYHIHTGVSFIHWIGQPYYVLTADDTLDKVDTVRLRPTVACISDLIGTYINKVSNRDCCGHGYGHNHR